MLSQSTYSFPVTNSTTIEISKEALRSLLGQIESELHTSEVYQRTMAGFQNLLGAAAESAQPMIKAVGREAIRLALGQFAEHCQVVAAASQETAADNPQQLYALKQLPQEDADHRVAIETHSFSLVHQDSSESDEKTTAYSVSEVLSNKSMSATLTAFGKPKKKLTKAEQAAQIMEQERQELLRHIGQELRQARLQRSLTLHQLHSRTLVPLHQIEALETGRVEELPEDVYLRGFIRRIGHALSLDGIALAASLPNPDPVKSVVPSWYHSNSTRAFLPGGYNLTPVHLYFGYAALVAGAVGGLACMSQKSSAGEPIELDPALSHPPSVSPSNRDAEPVGKPGLQSTKAGVKAGSDIAPPEAF